MRVSHDRIRLLIKVKLKDIPFARVARAALSKNQTMMIFLFHVFFRVFLLCKKGMFCLEFLCNVGDSTI